MKIPCNVIQDLLPLYTDGACSTESRNLVEEHLRECPACSEMLQKLKKTEILNSAVSLSFLYVAKIYMPQIFLCGLLQYLHFLRVCGRQGVMVAGKVPCQMEDDFRIQ